MLILYILYCILLFCALYIGVLVSMRDIEIIVFIITCVILPHRAGMQVKSMKLEWNMCVQQAHGSNDNNFITEYQNSANYSLKIDEGTAQLLLFLEIFHQITFLPIKLTMHSNREWYGWVVKKRFILMFTSNEVKTKKFLSYIDRIWIMSLEELSCNSVMKQVYKRTTRILEHGWELLNAFFFTVSKCSMAFYGHTKYSSCCWNM